MEPSKIASLRMCIYKFDTTLSRVLDLNKELAQTRSFDISEAQVERTRQIIQRYNEARDWVLTNYYSIGFQLPEVKDTMLQKEHSRLLPKLEAIMIGASSARDALTSLIQVKTDPEVLDKLDSLRRELSILEERDLDPLAIKDLEASIMEAEVGHFLASTMIASRVIQHIITKIPGDKDELKVKYLIDASIVSPDRKDEQQIILSAMRTSRNYSSHRIGLIPEPSDALIVLGGAFKLSNILPRLEK